MFKKWIAAILLVILLFASLLPNPLLPTSRAHANALFCTSTVGGVWSDPWCEIDSPEELNKIRGLLGGNFRLTNHIDLSGYNWTPIGESTAQPFSGRFDGNGYSISNLTINTGANNVGLFGATSTGLVESGAVITNVHLVDVQIVGVTDVGGLVGHALPHTLISGSSVTGIVEGRSSVGLLAGYNQGSINDSYTQGEVKIASNADSNDDSYGGVIGYNTGNVNNVYTTARMPGGSIFAGAFFGTHLQGAVTHSFWNSDTSNVAVASANGAAYVIQANTALMQRKSFYSASWDFSEWGVWNLIEDSTYPLHTERYRSVALDDLQVSIAGGGGVQPQWDTPFRSDLGVYTIKATAQTDSVNVAGVAMKAGSAVSGDGIISLSDGPNAIDITVTADDGLTAVYRLNVIRDGGTPQYPHRISSALQLSQVGLSAAYGLDEHYVLEGDIDLSGYAAGAGWQPVGSAANPFTGSFDGNRGTISNLTINRPGSDSVGLFGVLDGAEVSDVYLVQASVIGNDRVGGLAGEARGSSISGVAVLGSVRGDAAGDATGAIVGYVDDGGGSMTSLEESYAAATGVRGGLIGDGASQHSVSRSFWDSEVSGVTASSGGGTPATTADMRKSDTYTTALWPLGGDDWHLIEDGSYPMSAVALDSVLLSDISITVDGESKLLHPVFAERASLYSTALSSPASAASVSATVDDATTDIFINGQQTALRSVDLDWGDNIVRIEAAAPNGWRSEYRVTIASPQPKPVGVSGPSAGWYGIGDQLLFTVSYDFEVTASGLPELPISWNGSAPETAAQYTAASGGDPASLSFVYTVGTGDLHTSGSIALHDEISLPSTSAIAANAQPVSLRLLGLVPGMNDVWIDGLLPAIALSTDPLTPTNGDVAVEVDADGTGGSLAQLQWASGTYATAQSFAADATGKTDIAGDSFLVSANGAYTVYARDEAGNEAVDTITVSSILKATPVISLIPDTTAAAKSVDVTVEVVLDGNGSNNAVADARWVSGLADIADFASPAYGEAVSGNGVFRVALNGAYTVYVQDSVGNDAVATIDIANIVNASTAPVLPVPLERSFYIVPGRDHTLLLDDLELFIPAGAIERSMTVTLRNVTASTGGLFHDDQGPLSGVYELLKDEPGRFLLPVELRIKTGSFEWSDGERPVVAWYDENTKRWVALEGVSSGDIVSGETDHFTTFAVVAAETDEQENNGPGLTDIAGHWAEQALRDALREGVAEGYPDGTFRPDQPVNRAEYVHMLQRALGWTSEGEHRFADKSEIPAWAHDAVRTAFGQGIVYGYLDGTFRPYEFLSREEAAVIAARAARLATLEGGRTTFRDDEAIGQWAKPYIEAAVQKQLVQGQGGNRFNPQGNITRAEAAVLLLRIKLFLS